MVKKCFIVAASCFLAIAGIMVSCNKSNPATPQAPSIIGTWVGLDSNLSGGAGHINYYGVKLEITATNFILTRGNLVYGSSGSSADTAIEMGSWTNTTGHATVAAGDSLVFTADSCLTWDPTDTAANKFHKCLGYNQGPYYCECGTTIFDIPNNKFNISGNVWECLIPAFGDNSLMFTYHLTKQ
jgi:hypothetical protein